MNSLPPYSSAAMRVNGSTVLSVSGEIDLVTVDRFSDGVREQLTGGPLLLDLSAVSFMDSSGLRALVGLLRECSEHGWSLSIRSEMQGNIRRLLEMTGMLDVLPLYDGEPGPAPP